MLNERVIGTKEHRVDLVTPDYGSFLSCDCRGLLAAPFKSASGISGSWMVKFSEPGQVSWSIKNIFFLNQIVSTWKGWPLLNYAILMRFVSVCVSILWRILGGAWTRWKCQGERTMEIVNPEQWDWVWNHYVRRTMCGGTESPSTTAVILIAKQGQLFSSRETIISSMFQPLAIILSEHECRLLSLLTRFRVFLSQSHQGIILVSVIC